MDRMYCIMFTYSLNDDVRDTLLENAYLMLKSGSRKKKVRSEACEGVITTNFMSINLNGITGIQFNGQMETGKGKLNVSYIVRTQDLAGLEEAEYGAWLSPDERGDPPQEKIRPNPIHRAARAHQRN